jgi:hypothetical protein
VGVTALTDVAAQTSALHSRKYLAAAYNNYWYIGYVSSCNHEECDILVKRMEKRSQDILMTTKRS